jgi:hypothetical protein
VYLVCAREEEAKALFESQWQRLVEEFGPDGEITRELLRVADFYSCLRMSEDAERLRLKAKTFWRTISVPSPPQTPPRDGTK